MILSAHRDDFARRNLPPADQWPDLSCGEPPFKYPARINCVTELLDKAVNEKGWGERVAMRGPYGEITYRRLRVMANRIAHVLVDDLGVVSGNRVLLHSQNHGMMAASWLAIQKVGAIAVATMPLLHARELREIINRAQISHALCDEALTAELDLAKPHCPTLRHIEYVPATPLGAGLGARMHTKADSFDNVDTAADDVALIAFSSGSTGAPKGTVHFHRDVMTICDAFPQSILKPDADDIFCGSSPLGFTFGLGGLLLFPLRCGASTVLQEKASPEILLQTIQDYRATICFTVPTVYRQMTPRVAEYDLSTLNKCVSAGEPLPETTREAWRRATGIRLIDGLGSTEMLHIFISACGEDIHRGATGRAIPGYEATILDADGKPLPPRQIGRLAVRGPTGCRYLADDRQKEYVTNGWNITGDAAEIDKDGYIFHHGRTDDLIITAGQNVNGVEVEDVLMAHPAVAECAVIGVSDSERGQLVKACVVLNPGQEEGADLARVLQEHVRHSLAQYKYPRLVEFRKTLPRTESGKLQRFRLKTEVGGVEFGRRQNLQTLLPDGWVRPRGFANGIKATGTYVSIAGQVGWDGQRRFASNDFVEQARMALQNVVDVVAVAGGRPRNIVRLTWYVIDKREYLARAKELGQAYRSVMGAHYPAMTVVQVGGLIEDAAKIEIEATAVIQD